MKTPTEFVKINVANASHWCKVSHASFVAFIKNKSTSLIGTSIKNGKTYQFVPSDVIAYYSGPLTEVKGLGMPYIPTADVCNILDTIVPDSMGYETHIACRVVQEIVGKPLHIFVAEKLHYTELELCKALSAEQVDAVALAIYNIEYKQQGMIIGDQTGIGKGRVAAAMIRYGCYNKMKPIFLSEKPNLFSDIYRDLNDIGSGKLVPFIVNSRDTKTDIKDVDGEIVYQALPKNEQEKILKSGKMPAGYDFVCATYSQFSSAKEKPTKPMFLLGVSQGSLVIMDEAHNASGSSNTGEFLQKVIENTRGVVFLSATFAKRPDNMPVYALKTCISEANMSRETLVDAITKGGVALQEVLAAQLVSEGQMIRRERSFEGVEVNYYVLTEKEIEHKAIFDNITEVLRDIINFQSQNIDKLVKDMDKIAVAEGKEVEERKGTSKAGVDNQPYFSKVFMVVNQILFSLKAKSVAEMAIEHMNEGRKPIIAFSSTMESFFDDMKDDNGMPVVAGSTISIDFKTVLKKGLDGVLRYTTIDVNGQRKPGVFPVTDLSPEGQKQYYNILNKISNISVGITISPIDVIKNIIRKAGYSVEEITGRQTEVQIIDGSDNKGVLLNRKKLNANDGFRKFNNNEIDCLMINQSGSTGASAHAIVTNKVPKDKVKQRVMIILQPELDINREVQKRGRINRTGQIIKPRYDYVSSCVPAEKRLMMMLRKKLKSLDANTTSNQKQSENLMQIEDFLNKYGDKVVTEYLYENADLNLMIDDPLGLNKETEDSNTKTENAASKVSGRIAVLSTEQQEKFYNDIVERYNDFVEYLKQTDRYDLEVESLNLQAVTLEQTTVIEGKHGKSVFSEDTILEKCEINSLKKPYTTDELQTIIADNLKNGTALEQQEQTILDIQTYYSAKLSEDIENIRKKYERLKSEIFNEKGYDKASDKQMYLMQRTKELETAENESIELETHKNENRLSALLNVIRFFYIGKVVNYPNAYNDYVKAICLGYIIDKKKSNPYTASAIKIRIAIANSEKNIDLTISGEPGKKLFEIMGASTYIQRNEQEDIFKNWEYYTKKTSSNRRTAFIVTGNILQAFAQYTGKLISFTTMDGSIRKGIMLPDNYDPTQESRGGFVTVPLSNAKKYIQEMPEDTNVQTPDGKIIITRGYGYNDKDYAMTVPANKNYQEYFKDSTIIELCLNPRDGFEKRSSQMIAFFKKTNIENLIDYLGKKYNLSLSVSHAVYDAYFHKEKAIKTKTDIQERAEKRYQQDESKFEQRKKAEQPAPKMPLNAKQVEVLKLKLKLKTAVLKLKLKN